MFETSVTKRAEKNSHEHNFGSGRIENRNIARLLG
jgi:hypothetical protein